MNTHLSFPHQSPLPEYLSLPWQQTAIAIDCLQKKKCRIEENGYAEDAEQGNPLLPYLIHASVLLFLTRDMLAFDWVRRQPAFQSAAIASRVRQTPALEQSIALLKSTADTSPLAEPLMAIQDDALNAKNLRLFRNNVIQWGIPTESTAPADSPFPIPTLDYMETAKQAIAMWESLVEWQNQHAQNPSQ